MRRLLSDRLGAEDNANHARALDCCYCDGIDCSVPLVCKNVGFGSINRTLLYTLVSEFSDQQTEQMYEKETIRLYE